ncbi:hypothetical protein SAMN05444422_11359 [Halobiforma haloterrestris]|uniref:CbaC protein n=1 Tax=Natronobacterium haloterrestre TaxID=148448 RepID=A0A1I1KXK7_NATHA|nr:hypothetical protein SAMN05444422_11359 [Halobiforma haloterrestris]
MREMRVSPEALLVAAAFIVPFAVEFRTVLSWVGIELTALETALLGLGMILALLAWAFRPADDDSEERPKRKGDGGRPNPNENRG